VKFKLAQKSVVVQIELTTNLRQGKIPRGVYPESLDGLGMKTK
jgi:hypothetical protein